MSTPPRDRQELRLECLVLASKLPLVNYVTAVHVAKAYADFVLNGEVPPLPVPSTGQPQ